MKQIEQQWLSYLDEIVPKNAPAIQIQESKRAFYAGAGAVLTLITDYAEPDVPDEMGVIGLELLHRECQQFAADVEAGKQ